MGLTVEDVKNNANYNLNDSTPGLMLLQRQIGNEQLLNYNTAKELGANDDDEWSDWEERVLEHRKNK